jgi:uncharacterized protein YfiM (DUF2279 family)
MGSGTSVEDNRTEVIGVDGIMRPMRLLVLVLVLAFAPAPASASALFLSSADQGPWLAADKELHFAGSLAIAASLRVEGRSRRDALASTFAVGLLKETYDVALKPKRLKRGASWKDLAADLAGALAGVALIAAIDR